MSKVTMEIGEWVDNLSVVDGVVTITFDTDIADEVIEEIKRKVKEVRVSG